MTRAFAIFALLHIVPFEVARAAPEDPVRGFFSVEAYEVRLEALVRPKVFADKWDLPPDGIAREERQTILDRAAKELRNGVSAGTENGPLSFEQPRARFVVPDPDAGYVDDEREAIPLDEALIGIHLSADAALAEELEIEWNWFAPGQEKVAVEIAGPSRPAARFATLKTPRITWKAEQRQAAVEIDLPRVAYGGKRPDTALLVTGILLLAIGLLSALSRQRRFLPPAIAVTAIGTASLVLSFLWGTRPALRPEAEKTNEICYALLRQTYHAFDYRRESDIYDTLAGSVAGPLLEQVYLEVHQSLELGEQGGPRVKIRDIDLRKSELLSASDRAGDDADAFRAACEWATVGEVTHWGHTHERTNLYRAKMRCAPVEGQWRIVQLDLEEEKRIQRVSRRLADDSTEPDES